MLAAAEEGCRLITHLYSCTSTIRRERGFRIAGVVEAAYLSDEISAELIADGCHLPPSLLRLAYRLKGADRLALVTDGMRAAGTETQGACDIGGVSCVIEDGVAKQADRSAFAGSIARKDVILRRTVEAGVSLEDTVKMLEASIKAQNEFLNPDIKKNEALQLAAFNLDSKLAGKSKHYVEYFADAFSGITLWDKQLNNESLKAQISTETNIGPGYLHYNAEADLDEANIDSYYTFVYPKAEDKTTNAVIKGVTAAYKAQHPVAQIQLKDFGPESIARFIELKHFETLYTGNMLRRNNGNVTPKETAVPEVLQPNVEKYKKEVKANL